MATGKEADPGAAQEAVAIPVMMTRQEMQERHAELTSEYVRRGGRAAMEAAAPLAWAQLTMLDEMLYQAPYEAQQ